MTLHYTPAASGGWLAFASPTRVVLVSEADADTTAALWQAVSSGDSFSAALDVLARGGLGSLPSFALLDVAGDAARVIVRGAVAVTAATTQGVETVDGTGVSTWTERVVPAVTSLAVVVDSATPSSVDALPLAAGVVVAAHLVLELDPAGEPTAHQPKQTPQATKAPRQPEPVANPAVIDVDPEATVTEAPSAEAPGAEAASTEAARTEKPDTEQKPDDDYDLLFGDTVFRTPDVAATPDGDHDGETVLTADIAKLRAGRKSKRTKTAPPVQPVAPTLSLRLADGSREALSQPILVGRAPSVSQASGGQMPRLLTVGTADQDISRTHARIALEGETVVVTDLHSRNGTLIVLPGKDPQKLRAGEPTAVIVGTTVDFGGGITMTVEQD